MSYTTDLIKNRRQLIDTGSSGVNNTQPRPTQNTYTSNIIQQRRNQIETSQRTNQPSLPPLISQPQTQPETQVESNIFKKTLTGAKNLISTVGQKLFRTDDEILQIEKNDVFQKLQTAQQENRDTEKYKKTISLIAKIENPETPAPVKNQLKQFLRLDRYIRQGEVAFGQLVSSILDYSTQQEEVFAKNNIENYKRQYEQDPNNQVKKMLYDNAQKVVSGDIETKKISNNIKRWIQDTVPQDPTIPEQLANAGGSMLAFSLLTVGTGGNATVPLVLESMSEAGSVYGDLRDKGKSIDEASTKSSATLVGNIILGQFLNVFDDIGTGVSVKNFLIGFGKEGGQEGSQQVISNLATDRPIQEGVIESVIIGGISGGATQIAFANSPSQGGVPADPDVILNKLLNTDLAKTKEGKELIKRSLEAKNKGQILFVNQEENKLVVSLIDQAEVKTINEGVQPIETTTPIQEEVQQKATSGIELADNGVYADLTPEQLNFLKDEVGNIEFTKEDRPHLSPIEKLEKSELKKVSIDELRKLSPNIDKALTKYEQSQVKDLNKEFNQENTQRVVEETKSGQREELRLDNESNITKAGSGVPRGATPDTEVTIYRAGTSEIGANEYVTTKKEIAENYLSQREGATIFEKQVKVADLVDGGGIKGEFVYSPKEAQVQEDTQGEIKQTFDFSSTQLDLPADISKQIQDFGKTIPDSELYTVEGDRSYGREEESHITVLYGLDTTNQQEVRNIVESSNPIEVTLGKISIFENEDYDVVKVDVSGEQLNELNSRLDESLDTPGKTFDTYEPHITIAYVKSGEGQKYVGNNSFEGQTLTLNELTFSSKDGNKTTIELLGKQPEIEVTGNELTDYYNSQDQEAVGQAWYEVMTELDIAESGQRIFNEDGEFTGSIKSTFPDWVPEELRIRTLFDSVLKDISDPTNIKFPPNSQPRKQALVEEVLSIIDSRAGTDSSPIIESIKNAKEEPVLKQTKVKQEKTSRPISKSTTRSQKVKTVSSVESGLQTKGAEKLDNFELRKPPKKNSEEFKLYKKIEGLIRKYAQTVGEGYTPRGALGVYFNKTKNIRVNSMNDLSVASHEIAHFLDYANKITENLKPRSKVASELGDIYVEFYPGAKPTHADRLKMLEGFATLLQKYTEVPTTISEKYPTLVKEMLQPGGQFYHPVVGEILTDLNEIVAGYQELSSLDKISAKITSENTNIEKESFLNFWQKLRTQIADRVYPVEVLAQKTGRVGTKTDPSLWVRAYSSISGIINNNISTDRGYWAYSNLQDGFQKKYDYNWKTLVESISKRGVVDDFASYLVARREHFSYLELDQLEANLELVTNLDKEIQKINSEKYESDENYKKEVRDIIAQLDDLGIDPESKIKDIKASSKALVEIATNKFNDLNSVLQNDGFAREDVDKAYEEHQERFKDEEEMFDTLSGEDLEMLYNEDVQLINKKTYTRLKGKEGYASFKRQFYDEIVGESDSVGQVKVGGVKVSSLIKRKGSSRTIINPLYSALANHSEVMRKATKQIVYNQLGDIGKSGLLPTLFQEVQVKAIPDNRGRISFPQEKDPNIIMARENYKRKAILVDKSIKNTIDNLLTYKNIDVFTQLYTGLTRTFTAGTTGLYPQFAITNFVVDQITATANSYNKYRALYSPMKEMLNVMRNKNSVEAGYYEEYLVMGGERQTFTGWQKVQPKDLFKKISGEKARMEKAISLLNQGVDILSIPSAKSEIFSRATEYINARKSGKSQIVALEEAGRVTAPFHHIGEWGGDFFSTYIRGLPFFNASVQVLDQTIRVGNTKEGRQRMAFVTMAVTASYLASVLAFMGASDDQKEQYKDLEPEDLTNFVYLPNPSGEGLVRVKMSNTFSIPGAVMNMIIANKMFSADYEARDILEASTSFLPTQFQILEPKNILSWLPQLFKPVAYTVLNVKDYPRVTSLVSQSLQNLPSRYQYNEGTSAFAKKLGEKLDISPIKVDYLLTGYLGRASGFITGKPGVYNPGTTIFRDYYFTMGRRVTEFYEVKADNDGEYSAYQNHKPGTDDYDIDKVTEIYRTKIITDDMNDILTAYRKLDPEKDIEKASELRTLFFFYKEKLDDGTKPKNFTKWAKDADKRRNKNK